MSAVNFIEHRGKKILSIHFAEGMDNPLAGTILKDAIAATKATGGKCLQLVSFGKPELGEKTTAAFEQALVAMKPFVSRSAFSGITGPKVAIAKALLGLTNYPGKTFQDEREAMDYLAEEQSEDEVSFK